MCANPSLHVTVEIGIRRRRRMGRQTEVCWTPQAKPAYRVYLIVCWCYKFANGHTPLVSLSLSLSHLLPCCKGPFTTVPENFVWKRRQATNWPHTQTAGFGGEVYFCLDTPASEHPGHQISKSQPKVGLEGLVYVWEGV